MVVDITALLSVFEAITFPFPRSIKEKKKASMYGRKLPERPSKNTLRYFDSKVESIMEITKEKHGEVWETSPSQRNLFTILF